MNSYHFEFCETKTYRFHEVKISSKQSLHIEYNGEKIETSKNLLREQSIDFTIKVSDVCESIKGCGIYTSQIIRCSSSIGANIHEARYAQSRADFIHKLEIALKESSETDYWLEVLFRKHKIDITTYKELKNDCGIIRKKLIASITTAKNNQ